MREIINLLFVLTLISFLDCQILAQDNEAKIQKSQQEKLEQLKAESNYIAPIRYVIVYNNLVETSLGGRYLEIIMDEKQFNEENLIKVFELLKKRFPSPDYLTIDVHTNLATIETPEERELTHDSGGRLTDNFALYKSASYTRFIGGREAFVYTTSLSPYKEKLVVLVDKPIKIIH
jgi:hypothetical protein